MSFGFSLLFSSASYSRYMISSKGESGCFIVFPPFQFTFGAIIMPYTGKG